MKVPKILLSMLLVFNMVFVGNIPAYSATTGGGAPAAVSLDNIQPAVAADVVATTAPTTGPIVRREWNIGTTFPTGDIIETTEVNGLTAIVNPASDLPMNVQSSTKSNIKIDENTTMNFTRRLRMYNWPTFAEGSFRPTDSALSIAVGGDSTITVYGLSTSTMEDRHLIISKDDAPPLAALPMLSVSDNKAVTYQYVGPATTLYLYAVNGAVDIYYVSATGVAPPPAPPTPAPTPITAFREWNFSTASLPSGTIMTKGTVRDLSILKYASISYSSFNNVQIDSNKTMDFTQRVYLDRTPSMSSGIQTPADRAITFDVSGNSTITIVGTSVASLTDRYLCVSNGQQQLAMLTMPGYAGASKAVTYHYVGPATKLYLYAADGSAVNLYYVSATEDDPSTSAPAMRVWDMSTEFSSWGTIYSSTTIKGLTISSGATYDLSNQYGIQIDENTNMNFSERLKLASKATLSSGTYMPLTNYLSFDVAGDSKITVHALSGSAGKNQTFTISNGAQALVTFPAYSTTTTNNKAVSYDYVGPATKLYLYSTDGSSYVYYISATGEAPATPLPNFTPTPATPTPKPTAAPFDPNGTRVWNMSTDIGLGDVTTGTTINGLTIIPAMPIYAPVTVDLNNKSNIQLGGGATASFQQRLKFGYASVLSPDTYVPISAGLSFDVLGDSRITVYGLSSNSTEIRSLAISDGAQELVSLPMWSTTDKAMTYDYVGPAKTLYLYAPDGAINIYYLSAANGIVATATPTAMPTPTATPVATPGPVGEGVALDIPNYNEAALRTAGWLIGLGGDQTRSVWNSSGGALMPVTASTTAVSSIYNPGTYGDMDASVQFSYNASNGATGENFNTYAKKTGTTYYAANIVRGGSGGAYKLTINKAVNGTMTALKATTTDVKFSSLSTYDLVLSAVGQTITFKYKLSTDANYTTALTATDSDPIVSGGYGIDVQSGSGKFKITKLAIGEFKTTPTAITPTVTNGDNAVKLDWAKAAVSQEITKYTVYRSTANTSMVKLADVDVNTATYTDSTATNGQIYYYAVTSTNSKGESVQVSVSAMPADPNAAPDTPDGLTTSAGHMQVVLSWSAATGAAKYDVYQSTDDVTYTVAAADVTGTTTTIEGLTNGTLYYFKVKAKNAVNIESAGFSKVATATPAAPADKFTLTENGAWIESIYAEWAPYAGATSYVAYYKPTASQTYIKADAGMIYSGTRKEISNVIADKGKITNKEQFVALYIPGLQGGVSYDVKCMPVIGTDEVTSLAVQFTATPTKHDRTGFAFSPLTTDSTNLNQANGGYNTNGSGLVPSSAQILYVTDDNKDTITADVIDNKSGATGRYVGLTNIMMARQKEIDLRPMIIRFSGLVYEPTGLGSDHLLNLKTTHNVTVEGMGRDAIIFGWGFNIRESSNIEVRNLLFAQFVDDAVSVQKNNRNIWIHNNEFQIGKDGGGDKAKGDGSSDVKDDSSYVTISYNHYMESGKTSLCGMSDIKEFFVSYHHNFFDGSGSRHPRTRWATAHVYNNYYKNVYTYGIGATTYSSIFAEKNYFENTKRPMLISGQGTDTINGAENGTFSGNPPGTIKTSGNYMDAYSASTFREGEDNTLTTLSNNAFGQATYNNFDTDATKMYPYKADSPDGARIKVMAWSGRVPSSLDALLTKGPADQITDGEVVPTATPVVTVAPTTVPVVTATPIVTVDPSATPNAMPTPPNTSQLPVISTDKVWNFDGGPWPMATASATPFCVIGQTKLVDDMTLVAGTKNLAIDYSKKTISGVDVTGRLKFVGGGTPDAMGIPQTQYAVIKVAGNCTVSVYGIAPSTTAPTRQLAYSILPDGASVATTGLGAADVAATGVKDTIVYRGDIPAAIYLYSSASGFNIQRVELKMDTTSTVTPTTAPTTAPTATPTAAPTTAPTATPIPGSPTITTWNFSDAQWQAVTSTETGTASGITIDGLTAVGGDGSTGMAYVAGAKNSADGVYSADNTPPNGFTGTFKSGGASVIDTTTNLPRAHYWKFNVNGNSTVQVYGVTSTNNMPKKLLAVTSVDQAVASRAPVTVVTSTLSSTAQKGTYEYRGGPTTIYLYTDLGFNLYLVSATNVGTGATPTDPTATPAPTATATPTASPSPTATPAPTPSATPTAIPTMNPSAPTITVGTVSGLVGDEVDVDVSISNNTGIESFTCDLLYDNAKLTPISVIKGSILPTGTFMSNISQSTIADGVAVMWSDITTASQNGVLYTVRFKIKEGSGATAADLTIVPDVSATDLITGEAKKIDVNAVAGSVNIKVVKFGDIDSNSIVDSRDMLKLTRYLAGFGITLSPVELKAADVYADGVISTKDLLKLAQYLARWDNIVLGTK